MASRGLKTKAAPTTDPWRVAKTIKPGHRGALKLSRQHGPALICVRYRQNAEGTERITTIELVVEKAVIQKRDDPIVQFKIKQDEHELRRLAQAKGARYNGKNFMWQLRRSEVLRMGLRNRIAVTIEQLYQEHVHL